MGEAKYRKQNDPNYGQPTKNRGLILSCPISVTSANSFVIQRSTLDPQELRTSLLYWDKLSWPKNNIIGLPGCQDTEFLQSSGVLYRPKLDVAGHIESGNMFLEVQEELLTFYESKTPGMWSIGQGVNSAKATPSSLAVNSSHGIVMQLLNSVPTPGPDVPLADILDFKAKRQDELLQFREHFEKLVKQVTDHESSEEALQQAIHEVDTACADLLKTVREWQVPIKLSSLSASINFNILKAFQEGASAYGLIKSFNLGETAAYISAGAAAIHSQINIKRGIEFSKIKRPRSPYKYAYLVERDLK
ncbi:TPA: DUF6236 family protein [Pseudomonas aeruginosa]|uniref:DUF6236 family protein n=1 Tax=Pseudomonas aeruginosa TaxID=287 RepID=UPI000FFEBF18|nr:DUF6236 family protein [Pseudomonas aeruginosa]